MAYCSRCGAENKDDAVFCVSCGTRLKAKPAGLRIRTLIAGMSLMLGGFLVQSILAANAYEIYAMQSALTFPAWALVLPGVFLCIIGLVKSRR